MRSGTDGRAQTGLEHGRAGGTRASDVGGQRYYYRTVQTADITGDGMAEICGRDPNGLACGVSMGNHVTIALPFLVGSSFNDGEGYNQDKYAKLHMADLNGDGRADVCMRGPGGVMKCAFAPTTTGDP